jgi:hypothetical protein
MEYGNYKDHIQIGNAGDAVNILEQLLEKKELDQDVEKVIIAIKDAIKRGVI